MKILIATDGSKFSKEAVETVCHMVRNAEYADIKIVSAYTQPIMAVAAPYAVPVGGYSPALEKEMQEMAKQAVAEAEQQICRRFPELKNYLTTEVLNGAPETVIVERAEEWGADLIVVGSHGYGFWERMFLGSVSDAIVHHAPCSVMVVRKQKNPGDEQELKRLL